MQLDQIGELQLLKEIRKRFKSTDKNIVVGIGDDAAVITPQKERILVTTDMMNEGIHFDLSFSAPFHLGFKLVSVNVSDIMAMCGEPAYLFVNIAAKKNADENFLWGLFAGISTAINMYRMQLVGGDLSTSEDKIALSATAIGVANKVVTRCDASAGDRIYVTHTMGDSACGLEILKRLAPESKNVVQDIRLDDISPPQNINHLLLQTSGSLVQINWNIAYSLIKRHLMPIARDSGEFLPYAASMIDISDGLFIDLCRICDESNVGARIYLDKIPLSKEIRYASEIMGLDFRHLATTGGEDYELLFTIPASVSSSHIINATCIGEIVEDERIVVDEAGRESALKAEGYQHFGP
ncbi:thiamine-phosphate kinase [Thermodesulfovibrionales bacterium]|nr:thiamine-phosphate kinase [Thermodesulfovibrionales bacterium]